MIGPVSGTGRAMMASLQQAMAKGMPPDQAIQYVKSMATQGVAPLTDLYAMLNQFQRLKQAPVRAPQTPPTIRDQLNMMAQQQAAMQQGLGGLPAPAMEQAQFAGGGIVAFEEGGEVNPISYMQKLIREALARGDTETAEEIRASLEDYTSLGRNLPRLSQQRTATVAAVPPPAATVRPRLGKEATTSAVMFPGGDNLPPAPPAVLPASAVPAAPRPRVDATSAVPALSRPAPAVPMQKEQTREELIDAEMARREAYRKEKGIGAADEEMRNFLSEENNRLAEQFGRDKMLAFAEAGFKMAAAASRPGATFLGAFSEGAITGTQALRGLQREMDANRRGLKEAMIKMRQADELRKEGEYDKAAAVVKETRAEIFEREKLDRQLAADIERTRISAGASIRSAQISANARTTSSADRGGLTENQAIDNRLNVLNRRAAFLESQINAYDKRMGEGYDITTAQTEAYNKAVQELRNIDQERDKLTLSGSAPSATASVGGSNPYANMSDEQLLQALGG